MKKLKEQIENAWNNRELLKSQKTIDAINMVIDQLDSGNLRVSEPTENGWILYEWIKKAVVMYFPTRESETLFAGPMEFHDKLKLKTGYAKKGIRVVPHAIARYGSFIDRDVILMPSYVNIGAYVGSRTMIDTWATVGSCAQIDRKRCSYQWRGRYWRSSRTATSFSSINRGWRFYRFKMHNS